MLLWKGKAMYEKIKTYIRRYSMIEKEDVVIAGVSGGADSVCLLLLLEKLKKNGTLDWQWCM